MQYTNSGFAMNQKSYLHITSLNGDATWFFFLPTVKRLEPSEYQLDD